MKAFIGFLVCALIATAIYYMCGIDEEDKGENKSLLETIADATENAKNQQPDVLKEFSTGLPDSTTAELLKKSEELRDRLEEKPGGVVEELSKGEVALKTKLEDKVAQAKSGEAYNNELGAIRQKYKVEMIVIGGHSLAIINGKKRYVGDSLEGGVHIIKMDRKTVTIKSGTSEYTLMK